MTRPNPHGCPRCGRLECEAAEAERVRLAEAQKSLESRAYLKAQAKAATKLFECKLHGRVDWQAECRALTPDAEVLAAAVEVLRLAEGATEGPWEADLDWFGNDTLDGNVVACVSNEKVELLFMADTDCEPDNGGWGKARAQREIRDATFIAAVRTLAPQLAAWVAGRGKL